MTLRIADTPIDFPGPPPWHWNCRTILVPIVKSAEELTDGKIKGKLIPGTRASMHGEVPDNLTYEDWFRTLPEAEQIEILGEAKHRLWKTGKLSFIDMVDQRNGHPLTIAELQALVDARTVVLIKKAPPIMKNSIVGAMTPEPGYVSNERAFQRIQSRAWANADAQTASIISSTDPLNELRIAGTQGSHYDYESASIYLSSNEARNVVNNRVDLRLFDNVFRHEYGHHVDYARGSIISGGGDDIYVPRSFVGADREKFDDWSLQGDSLFDYDSPLLEKADIDAVNHLLRPNPVDDLLADPIPTYDASALQRARELLSTSSFTESDVLAIIADAGAIDLPTATEEQFIAAYSDVVKGLVWKQPSFLMRSDAVSQAGLMADLIGSATKNTIVHGNHDNIYLSDPTSRATEVFANYVALRGNAGDPAASALLRFLHELLPETSRELEKLYDAIEYGY